MVIKISCKPTAEKMVAFLYAVSYFLGLYTLPGLNMNAAYFPIMFVSMAYLFLSFGKGDKKSATRLWPLFFSMLIYVTFNQLVITHKIIYNPSTSNMVSILSIFAFIYLCILTFRRCGKIRKYYIKCIENIAIVMSAVVLIQCLLYYAFGISISYDRTFLLPFRNAMTAGVQDYLYSSRMVINGNFRPSAFFLEPAHMSQFCTIGLASLLLKDTRLFNKKAIFVSLGILLTTSGLGIACVFALWGISLFINGDGLTAKKISRIFLGMALAIAAFTLAFIFSSSFQKAVIRVFVASNGYNSAIEGRLWSRSFLENLVGTEALFGMGYKNIPVYGRNNTQYYMTGIIEMLYCQGVVGTVLFCSLFIVIVVQAMKHKNRLSLIILALFIPFFFGSSCLTALTLCNYIPYLYYAKSKDDLTQSIE